MASTFGATLDEQWLDLPPLEEVKRQLADWGIYDDQLRDLRAKERYVRFSGVKFGVAPEESWPKLRRDLLQFEDGLACR